MSLIIDVLGVLDHLLCVHFVELKDIRSMERFRDQWDSVAASAAEPNPFYEAWALEPAFEHLAQGSGAMLVGVQGNAGGGELIGVFPVARRRGYHHLPVAHRGLWRHVHCFLSTPLMRAGHEADAWRGFFNWARHRGPLVDLDGLAADGPVFQGLVDVVREAGHRFEFRSVHHRPLLAPTVPGDSYLELALRKKRRRQFERKREILEEGGEVSFGSTDNEETLRLWLDDFIELESKGWKGKGHTAIRERANERAFFHALVRRGASRGKIRAYRLALGEKPVAMRFDLMTNGAAFALKIAYDEMHARCSPGALLEIEILRECLSKRSFTFVDSCTIPSPDSVHGYFWQERRAIGSVVVAAPTVFGRALMTFGRSVRVWKGAREGNDILLPDQKRLEAAAS